MFNPRAPSRGCIGYWYMPWNFQLLPWYHNVNIGPSPVSLLARPSKYLSTMRSPASFYSNGMGMSPNESSGVCRQPTLQQPPVLTPVPGIFPTSRGSNPAPLISRYLRSKTYLFQPTRSCTDGTPIKKRPTPKYPVLLILVDQVTRVDLSPGLPMGSQLH